MTMILLIDPKYPHNVGAAVRAASCLGAEYVWFTGDRVSLDRRKSRLPREERMKDYQDVNLGHIENPRPFSLLPPDMVPVAVEIVPGSEPLPQFEHPENAAYVFGPEDGSLGRAHLGLCHRFVSIPTSHCINLAAAVYITLYDKMAKTQIQGWPNMPSLDAVDDDDWLIKELGLK